MVLESATHSRSIGDETDDIPCSGSLLDETYWSGSAYQLGIPPRHRAIKYAFLPCAEGTVKAPRNLTANYYRDELVAHLSNGSACWNFALQEQTSRDMPIDA
ncbi:MAG: hypothetical protein ACRESZ_19930 [Methylococcales bacterium]